MNEPVVITVAEGRGGYRAVEIDGSPFVVTPKGDILKAHDGQKFFLSCADDDVLFATRNGWETTDESVVCFGARIQ